MSIRLSTSSSVTEAASTREAFTASSSYCSICLIVRARGIFAGIKSAIPIKSPFERLPIAQARSPAERSHGFFRIERQVFHLRRLGVVCLDPRRAEPRTDKVRNLRHRHFALRVQRAKIQGARRSGGIANKALQENKISGERIENVLPWTRRLRISQHYGTTDVLGTPDIRNQTVLRPIASAKRVASARRRDRLLCGLEEALRIRFDN